MQAISYETEAVKRSILPSYMGFCKQGVAPKTLEIDMSSDPCKVKRQHIQGVPLAAILCFASYDSLERRNLSSMFDEAQMRRDSDCRNLLKIYGSLGTRVGLVNGSGVSHNDLHADNIIISKEGIPYIIDWEKSDVYKEDDSEIVLLDTKICLRGGAREILPSLEKAYYKEFHKLMLKV